MLLGFQKGYNCTAAAGSARAQCGAHGKEHPDEALHQVVCREDQGGEVECVVGLPCWQCRHYLHKCKHLLPVIAIMGKHMLHPFTLISSRYRVS